MKRLLITLLAAVTLSLSSCTDSSGTTEILTMQGYRNIEITGYRFFAGSKEDWYATGFRATAPNGQTVTGCVTRGLLFKGKTVRFD